MDARLLKLLQKSMSEKDVPSMISCVSSLKAFNNTLTHSWRDYELDLSDYSINSILSLLRASGISLPLKSRLTIDNMSLGDFISSKSFDIRGNIHIVPHYPASAFSISTHQDSFEAHTNLLPLYHFKSVFLSGNQISMSLHDSASSFTGFVVNTPEILLSAFLSSSPKPIYLAGNTLLFNHQYGTNYFHAVIEEAAKFEFYITNLPIRSVSQFIFDGPSSAWHRSFLELGASFFISSPSFLFTSHNQYQYHLKSCYSIPFRLTLKSSTILARSFWSRCISREVDSLECMFGPTFGSRFSSYIYIPRGSNGTKRVILNESLLIDKLLDHGFYILDNQSFSPLEQIYLCSRASLILGLHGAGLANSILMKPGSVMIEITPSNYRTDLFPTFCSILSFGHIFSPLPDTLSKDSPITLSDSDITNVINNVRSII